MKHIDFGYLKRLHLAGDFYLWKCFAQSASLEVVSCIFAGFRIHKGQLSTNIGEYRQEMEKIADEKNVIDIVRVIFHRLEAKLLRRFTSAYLIKYDFNNESW